MATTYQVELCPVDSHQKVRVTITGHHADLNRVLADAIVALPGFDLSDFEEVGEEVLEAVNALERAANGWAVRATDGPARDAGITRYHNAVRTLRRRLNAWEGL